MSRGIDNLRSVKHRAVLIVAALFLATLGLLLRQLLRAPEPAYLGKPVSYWIKQLAQNRSNPASLSIGGQTTLFGPINRAAVATPALARSYNVMPASLAQADSKAAAAIHALKNMGARAVPYLAKALRTHDSIFSRGYRNLYQAVAPRLGSLLPKPPLSAANLQAAAADALAVMPDVARPAYPALLAASDDPNPYVVHWATLALNNLSDRDPEICAALNALIKPDLPATEALPLIERFHLNGPSAIQALIASLADRLGRCFAMSLLEKSGTDAIRAVPALIQCAKEGDPFERMSALETLCTVVWTARFRHPEAACPEADLALPIIAKALKHEVWSVRQRSAQALGTFHSPAALQTLQQATNDPDPNVVRAVADSLQNLARSSLAEPDSDLPPLQRPR
jgi:HEAT repeat protein